jgi:hypothetical protein
MKCSGGPEMRDKLVRDLREVTCSWQLPLKERSCRSVVFNSACEASQNRESLFSPLNAAAL